MVEATKQIYAPAAVRAVAKRRPALVPVPHGAVGAYGRTARVEGVDGRASLGRGIGVA